MRSIRQGLRRRLLLSLTVLCLLIGTAFYFALWVVLVREFDARLAAEARSLASLVEFEDDQIEFQFSSEIMPEFAGGKNPSYFTIELPSGDIFGRSPTLAGGDLKLERDAIIGVYSARLPDGRRGRIAYLRQNAIREGIEGAPEVIYVTVAKGTEDLHRILFILAVAVVGTALLTPPLITLPLKRAVRRELKPLEEIARELQRTTPEHLSSRFPTEGIPAELLPVTMRLNELMAKLQDAMHRERRFTTDAAHELRTPIAELRSLSDVALRNIGDPRLVAQMFEGTREVSKRMEHLVKLLLAVARAQQGEVQPDVSEFDVESVVAEVWRLLEHKATARSLRFNWVFPKAKLLRSDIVLFRTILTNLVENAVEYSTPASHISVEFAPVGGGLRIEFRNKQDHLTEDDLASFFQPFWRKSRARHDGDDHCGLGLALVASQIKLLGGTVESDLEAGGVLCIRLFLPSMGGNAVPDTAASTLPLPISGNAQDLPSAT